MLQGEKAFCLWIRLEIYKLNNMLNQEQIQQIYQWWHVFKNDGDLVEVRCIGDKVTFSGYYKNVENLIRDVGQHDDCNVYYTINPINESCHGRPQCEQMIRNPKNTTTDAEIIGRSWVFIDFDCEKVTNVNSTKEEKEFAHRKALEVYRYLKKEGFNEPVIVDSSNGYHAFYPCRLAATEENDLLVSRFLKALAMMFSDEHVSIDVKTANRARVVKLAGTFSRKGSALSTDRPQRMCKILKVPSEIIAITKEYFQKVADIYPEEEVKPTRENHYSTEKFDLVAFLQKHGIGYKAQSVAGGTKYILDHCVFDDAHKGKDAVIFQRDNGAIAYHCFHSHCEHYKWADVRKKYEPDAYDKKEYREFQHKQQYFSKYVEPEPIKAENPTDGKKWLTFDDIQTVRDEDLIAVPTGIYMIDKLIKGFILGEVTMLSGINASGKTSFLNTLALNAIQKGFNVALWSGELQSFRLKSWIAQAAAGKMNVTKVAGSEYAYETNESVLPKIGKWLSGKLFIYNNNYGNLSDQLISDITECIEQNKTRFIILDNLMAISLDSKAGDKNEKQKQIIMELSELAKAKNVHILLVAHPRKEANMTLLRKESISGTSDLTNVVQNVMLIHRVGLDFEKRATEFWGKEVVNDILLQDYGNVIEIAKNRSYGVVDRRVGLYYEPETRRFKNSKAEQVHYDWEEALETYTAITPNQSFDTPQSGTETPKVQEVVVPTSVNEFWGSESDDMYDNLPFA